MILLIPSQKPMLWVLIRIIHNKGIYEDLTKLSFNYHQISSNTRLISSSGFT